jgi:hypothetical protein
MLPTGGRLFYPKTPGQVSPYNIFKSKNNGGKVNEDQK